MWLELGDFLTLDAGSLRNGSVDSTGYGSYHLEVRSGQEQTIRLYCGIGVTIQRVCDPAEYRMLTAALKDLRGSIQRAGKSPSGFSLLVHTDSQRMGGQLSQSWPASPASARRSNSATTGAASPAPRAAPARRPASPPIGSGRFRCAHAVPRPRAPPMVPATGPS